MRYSRGLMLVAIAATACVVACGGGGVTPRIADRASRHEERYRVFASATNVAYVEQAFGARTLPFNSTSNSFGAALVAPSYGPTPPAPEGVFLGAQEGGGYIYAEIVSGTNNLVAYQVSGGSVTRAGSISVPVQALIFPGSAGLSAYVWQQGAGGNQTLTVYSPNLETVVGSGPTVAGVAGQVPDPLSPNAYVVDAAGTFHVLQANKNVYGFVGSGVANVYTRTTIPGTFPPMVVLPDGNSAYICNGSKLSIVDPHKQTLKASIGLTSTAIAVAMSPNGSNVYVLESTGSGQTITTQFETVQTSTNTVTKTSIVATNSALSSTGIAVSGDGTEVLIPMNATGGVSASLYVFHSSGTELAMVPAPSIPTPGQPGFGTITVPLPMPSPQLIIVEEAVSSPNPLPSSSFMIISSPNPAPSPIMIGQQVRVGVREAHGEPVSSPSWSSPAPAVYGFNIAAKANPISTFPADAFTSSDFSFYWTQTDNAAPMKVISVAGYVNGVKLNAKTTYTVYEPSNVTNKGTYGTVGSDEPDYSCVDGEPSPYPSPKPNFLHIGYPCNNGVPGMKFTVTATNPSPAPVSGVLEMIQLIAFQVSAQPTPYPTGTPGTPARKTSTQPPSLDNEAPYGAYFTPLPKLATATYTEIDAPAFALEPTKCVQYQASEQFVDYYMYQPSPTPARSSIPVNIAIFTWGWSGSAEYEPSPKPTPTQGGWSLTASATDPPSPSPSPTMPSWTGTYTNGSGIC